MSTITTYGRISNNSYSINGDSFLLEGGNVKDACKNLYTLLDIKYPKYHKMDLLSKVAFLGTELLITKNKELKMQEDDAVAMFFSNSESSLYSDLAFEKSYKEGSPSPARFVYTLPNILLGEIAIRNKWFGESIFMAMPKFDAKETCQQIELMLANGSKCCVGGWVNVCEEKIDAFFYIVKNGKENMLQLTETNLLKLYTNYDSK